MRTDRSLYALDVRTHQNRLQVMNPIMIPVRNHLIMKQAKNRSDMEDELEQCMG